MRKIIRAISLLIVCSLIVYFVLYKSGNIVDSIYGDKLISEEAMVAKANELGLNDSFLSQYGKWLFNFIKGNWGYSYVNNKSVFALVMSKMGPSLIIGLISWLVMVILSIVLGIINALKKIRIIDYICVIGNCMPSFALGYILLLLFGVRWKVFKISGSYSLAIICLVITMSSKYIPQITTLVLEEMKKPYVEAGLLRGIKKSLIVQYQVLPNCIGSFVSVLGLSLASLLGGVSVIETVFNIDGIGHLLVNSILSKDIPVVCAYVMWMVVVYVLVMALVDIMQKKLNPRSYYEK